MPAPPIDKLRHSSLIAAALLAVMAASCDSDLSSRLSSADTTLETVRAGKTDTAVSDDGNRVKVSVKGAVIMPGVYVLNRRANVAEAIVEAGGLTDQATLETVNLKAPLQDKMTIVVPVRPSPIFRKTVPSAPSVPRVNNVSGTPGVPVRAGVTVPARPVSVAPIILPAKIEPLLEVTVKGAVARPGIYHLLPGDVVAGAIAASGGMAPNAKLGGVNLNERLRQGMTITIPAASPELVVAAPTLRPAPVPKLPTAATAATKQPALANSTNPEAVGSQPLLDINSATVEQLQRLPGVGPSLAVRIVAYRKEVGAFRAPEQLMDVKGISPEKFTLIHSRIRTN